MARNEPKLTKISKLTSFSILVLNKFFINTKWPLEEIGNGSVIP